MNASLPEGATADTIILEQAVELLAAKAATSKGAAKARSAARAAAKPSAKKATPKTAAAKAVAAKKPPATTKSGRLRASAVRVIKPAGS